MLVSANPPAVISSGHVALRQTEIGHFRAFGVRGIRNLNVRT
jgi:hypothetical protein